MRITLDHLRWACFVAASLAFFAFGYALGSAPTRVPPRLGMRGYKRQRALQQNAAWAVFEPWVRWLGVRLSGIVSDEQRAALDRQIMNAGDYLGLVPEEYVALSVLGGVGGVVFGGVFGYLCDMGPIVVALTGPLGAGLPYLTLSGEAERRLKAINRGLPYALDLLALSMSAGQDFPGAVRQVVEKSSNPEDPLTEEFSRMLQELQVGSTRRGALLGFSERVASDTVSEFVNAVVQAEDRGNPVADVLQTQAAVSRQRRTVKAEEKASSAAVKMVGPLFLIFGCIMLLVLAPMLLTLAAQKD